MSDLLLQTKLYKPALRPSLISRPQLIAQLNAGLGTRPPGFAARLTLVCAPAGYGKTTLVSAWLAQLDTLDRTYPVENVAWFSLDENDNDPLRFLAYLIAALQMAAPHIGQDAAHLLQSPRPPAIETILTLLINKIGQDERPLILVLDDYHAITNPAIHQALTFLLDHVPPSLHLLIATRSDLPLSLSSLRARGQMVEIRGKDLRFTLDEARLFFNQVMILTLSNEELTALEQRTEGWIAGLQLAALSMQGRDDLSAFISDFAGSHRFIVDYLTDEVLQRRPKGTREFLLQTAILDRFCGPLCDAVTGQNESQAILEQLERANLFLIPLDDDRRWYRYHHLFADVLRNRLRQASASPTDGVTLPAALHRRASAWFEQEGLIDEAIRHALAAPDVERVASLVERYSVIMIRRSEVFLVRTWLEQLPVGLVQSRPRLILARGWTLIFTGQIQALEQWLATPPASTTLAAPDLPDDVLGELATLQATLARFRGESARSLDLAQKGLRYLADDDRGLQAGAMYSIGVAHLRLGNIAEARQAFLETTTLGETQGGPHTAFLALQDLSQLHIRQGQLSQAAETCQKAMELAARWNWQAIPAAGLARICLGQVLYERNDLVGAAQLLADGIALLRGSIEQYVLTQGYVTLARVLQAGGDFAGAFAAIRRSEEWFTQMRVTATGASLLLETGKVRLWLGQGTLDAAAGWARSCDWRPEGTQSGYLQAVTRVRLRLAQSRQQGQRQFLSEAAEIVNRMLPAAETGEWWGEVIELSLLRALVCQAQGDSVGTLGSLERALTLAEPEGYVRIFLDEGEPMHLLLADYQSAIRQKIATSVDNVTLRLLTYTEKLLAAFSQTAPATRPTPETILEPLSERELEILRLIATGRTNKEIAALLVIAVSTVKSHINSLYGKLGTNRRTEALAIARELGLLPD